MALFEYNGIDSTGKTIKGVIDADNIKTAREKLRGEGIYPTHLSEGKGRLSLKSLNLTDNISLSKRIKPVDRSLFYRQLATLTGAGIPLVESLSGLIPQTENMSLKRALTGLRDKITEGSSFHEAAKERPELFSDLFVNMIEVGEISGTLEIILARLADISEEDLKLRLKVRGALFYPILMALIGSAIMFFLMAFVIPQVTEVFNDFNTVLPLPTRILLGFSLAFKKYWYLFLVGILSIPLLLKRYRESNVGKEKIDSLILKIPFIGKLYSTLYVARFTRTLSILLSSGIPMIKAMDIVGRVVNNNVMSKAILEARDKIEEGNSMAEPLKNSGLFPGTVIQMIMVGENSGELEGMLDKSSDAAEYQLETAISSLTSIIEPIIILVMGGLVGFIVISILLPIFEMSQLVK